MEVFDVIVVGGGPAGLNAAVVLGRCHRKVLVFDHGKQRNRHSHGMHNYLTRDDISPKQFIRYSHNELKKYGVRLKRKEIRTATKNKEGLFEFHDINGRTYFSKKMILATGLTDHLPDIPGTHKFYGKSLHHCPYCDAWEHTGKKFGVYACNENGVELAQNLQLWTPDVTLYTDGEKFLTPKLKKLLDRKNIAYQEHKISNFKGRGHVLKHVVFTNGEMMPCDVIFTCTGYSVQCHLVESLGCNTAKNLVAITNKYQQTNIKGLYVAGDTSRDVHFVVVAAAEGAKAAVYINKELLAEERKVKN